MFTESWDALIPLDHPVRGLRSLLESLDLSFLESLYDVKGGIAYDPRKMLGVVLYGIGDGVRSSRQLEEHCRFDNRYRFLMEGQTPDDRTFGRFLERLTEDPETLLHRIMEFAQARITLRAVSADGTKLRASVSRYAVKAKGAVVAVTDADCRVMKDRSGYFHGYNCQLAVDADSELIVGAELTQSQSDWHELETLLDSVESLTGRVPETVVADSGYETASNAALCEARDVTSVLNPHPSLWTGWSVSEAGEVVCPVGEPLVAKGVRPTGALRLYRRFRIAGCPRCALKSACLPEKARYRFLYLPDGVDPASRIRNLHRARSDAGALLLQRRARVAETPHAQLKHNDGLRQFQRRGLAKARVEFLLWVASYNLRKLLRQLLWLLESLLRAQNTLRTERN